MHFPFRTTDSCLLDGDATPTCAAKSTSGPNQSVLLLVRSSVRDEQSEARPALVSIQRGIWHGIWDATAQKQNFSRLLFDFWWVSVKSLLLYLWGGLAIR